MRLLAFGRPFLARPVRTRRLAPRKFPDGRQLGCNLTRKLALQAVVKNLDHLFDVGDTEDALLAKILLCCSAEQLERIQHYSKGRDLSAIANEPWRRCYRLTWGAASEAEVLARYSKGKQSAGGGASASSNSADAARRDADISASINWHKEYKAKEEQHQQKQKQTGERLRQLYEKDDKARKSRQVVFCAKPPPSVKPGSKRKASGSAGPSHGHGGSLMKKSLADLRQSFEFKARRKSEPVVVTKRKL
eukprot:jgi/Mesvir1/17257/Mv07667-RA.1